MSNPKERLVYLGATGETPVSLGNLDKLICAAQAVCDDHDLRSEDWHGKIDGLREALVLIIDARATLSAPNDFQRTEEEK